MDYMTPDARAKLDRIERAHTVDDPGRQVVVRQVGDVRVTIDLPSGAPVPEVKLYLYQHSATLPERVAALEAFRMTDQDLFIPDDSGSCWYDVTSEGVEATVWFGREERP